MSRERPVLFSGAMVRAILAGAKTMTRRVVKLPPAPNHLGTWEADSVGGAGTVDSQGRETTEQAAISHTRTGATLVCPYGVPGDRLWVKEALVIRGDGAEYGADGKPAKIIGGWRWKLRRLPGMFMPYDAHRIALEVTGVRVQRVQDISEEDARAEGTPMEGAALINGKLGRINFFNPRTAFAHLWDSINGKRPGCDWASNPFVWAIEFRRVPSTPTEKKEGTP